jgi:hypothetical protein
VLLVSFEERVEDCLECVESSVLKVCNVMMMSSREGRFPVFLYIQLRDLCERNGAT